MDNRCIYTARIIDETSPHFGMFGLIEYSLGKLFKIRFPGGDSDWFYHYEFVDENGEDIRNEHQS